MVGGLNRTVPDRGTTPMDDAASPPASQPETIASGVPVDRLRLGNRLRVARAELRLSQEALATLAGVTRQTIGSIENGQYCPSALLAFVLARRLGKPVAELFFLEEGPA